MDLAAHVLARWADPAGALTGSERARADRFATQALKDEFTAAHLLAREQVAELVGIEPADVVIAQRCDECGGEHGRPSVVGRDDVHVSWSHSHGTVGAIASTSVVGLDIEAPRERPVEPGLLRRTATDAERALIEAAADPTAMFLRMWVLKESLIKVGRIAMADLARTDVSAAMAHAHGRAVVLGCQLMLPPHPRVTLGTAHVTDEET